VTRRDLRLTRRDALQAGALGAAGLAFGGLATGAARADVTQDTPLPLGTLGLDDGWLFGPYAVGAEQPGDDESGLESVALPHTVTALSWSEWSPSSWESTWIYRLHVSGAALAAGRSFVDFQGVMTSATVYLNGTELGAHAGGYLPFSVELTNHLAAGDNVLAVRVDGTVQDVPPNDVAIGDSAIDFLQPAGIYRDVALRIVPEVFISDVFAKPTDVLGSPGLDALVTIDAGTVPAGAVTITASVLSGASVLGQASTEVTLTATGPTRQSVAVSGLAGIALWSPEDPQLYAVQVTITVPGEPGHEYMTRTGFREATFEVDGFYLNGSPYPIFGINRHQLYPYTAMAAPERLQRRDAEIIRGELNCNMVRCSHYPQSDWFLDACDELGLMVWEEPPGWGYVGDAAFAADVLQNMQDLVTRDRSRPSLIVWATRLNETSSEHNEGLYGQTNAIAASLDGTRQTTGAMNQYSLQDWNQQVFAYDDYHSITTDGVTDATLNPPIGGVPYLVSESVGALDGAPLYRFIDTEATLALQAQLHAQVHSLAGGAGYAGLLGWCAVDYASTNGASSTPSPSQVSSDTSPAADRVWRNLKTPGVLDTFRAVKPGASTYQAQVPAGAAPFILPAFFWDFQTGASGNPNGPGPGAIAFTNCDSLAVYVGAATSPMATVTPDAVGYPHLVHPPAFIDFPPLSGSASPDLRIEGLIDGAVAATLVMSSDITRDQLSITTDDAAIIGDGTDATRFTVRVLDAYGSQRHFATGSVALSVSGPGDLVADASFDLGSYGTALGGFLRGAAGADGTAVVTAHHPTYAPQGVAASVQVSPGIRSATAAGAGGPRTLNPEAVVAAAQPAPAASAAAPPPAAPPPSPPASPPAVVTRRASPRALSDATIRAALHHALSISAASAHIDHVLADGAIATFHAPAAGRLTIGWYATVEITTPAHHGTQHRRRRVLVATAGARITRAGRARVRIRLTARGRMLLRHVRFKRLTAEATFRIERRGRAATVRCSREITLHR
jgi:beta-galactosidase